MTDLSVAKKLVAYKPKNKVRFVTAAALFDGHDASINIMRRILQSTGSEVIHLGHNRSVGDIVNAALQEDVQGKRQNDAEAKRCQREPLRKWASTAVRSLLCHAPVSAAASG